MSVDPKNVDRPNRIFPGVARIDSFTIVLIQSQLDWLSQYATQSSTLSY